MTDVISEFLGSGPQESWQKGPSKQSVGASSGHLCPLGVVLASPHVVITCLGGDLPSAPDCELPESNGLSCWSLVPSVQHRLGTFIDIHTYVYYRRKWRHDIEKVL